MKALQLLAAMSVLALSLSACSTTNTAAGGMGIPVLSGEQNPNTGRWMPPAVPAPPPKT